MQSSDPTPALEHATIDPANDFAMRPRAAQMQSSLRQTLRSATSAIHARLHLHAGFAAIDNGTINLVEYRALLVRLYGFHVSFEAAVDMASERSAWLRDDLASLGLSSRAMATIPRCTALAAFDTPARRIGALYVVEGSTLGGRHLARKLDSLFGRAGTTGRRFFEGRGADTTAAWNAFQARLNASAGEPSDGTQIVESAVVTFGIFQEWLHGWKNFP